DQSVALRTDAGETWIALGAYRYRVLRDFPSALQAYDEARKRLPNNASVLQYMAYVERRLGQWERATEHYRRAAELDPRDFQIFVSMGRSKFKHSKLFLVQLGYCQEWSGQSDEARLTYARAVQSIKSSPDFVVAPEGIGLP